MTPQEVEQMEKTRRGERRVTLPSTVSSTIKKPVLIIEPPTSPNLNGVTPLVVTAKASVNNSVFSDVNQTARVGADAQKPTLIAERIAKKNGGY